MTAETIGTSADRQFRVWYLGGHFGWMCSWGLLKVIYVYLITIELGESPERVGFASSMLLVPSLLFALIGGTTADKFDIRKILIWLQCFAGLATVVLALAMKLGFLSYSLLIVYALFVGTIDPFVIPARNSLLNRVASDIQRAVAMANAVQFVAKLIGHVLIGLASIVGALPLVWLLPAMKLGSGLAAVPMNAAPPRKVEGGDEQSQIVRIRDGLRVVHRSAEMFPAILTQAAVGWIGGGIGVIGAILIRDEYAGGAQEFIFITLSFSFGAIVATMSLVRIGEIRRPGRALALSFLVGIAVLLLVSRTQPFVVYCIMVFIWGISAGLIPTALKIDLHAPNRAFRLI